MVETVLNKKQIVLETVEEYSDPSNRALFFTKGGPADATCRYRASNGNKCGVGRCMTKDALAEYATSSRKFGSLLENKLSHDSLLEDMYHGQSLSFWQNIQKLHDTDHFWSEDGITEKGVEFIGRNFNVEL